MTTLVLWRGRSSQYDDSVDVGTTVVGLTKTLIIVGLMDPSSDALSNLVLVSRRPKM